MFKTSIPIAQPKSYGVKPEEVADLANAFRQASKLGSSSTTIATEPSSKASAGTTPNQASVPAAMRIR